MYISTIRRLCFRQENRRSLEFSASFVFGSFSTCYRLLIIMQRRKYLSKEANYICWVVAKLGNGRTTRYCNPISLILELCDVTFSSPPDKDKKINPPKASTKSSKEERKPAESCRREFIRLAITKFKLAIQTGIGESFSSKGRQQITRVTDKMRTED